MRQRDPTIREMLAEMADCLDLVADRVTEWRNGGTLTVADLDTLAARCRQQSGDGKEIIDRMKGMSIRLRDRRGEAA